ncbi:tigger transposable element-derived protein 4-like [Acyrthosiphon pisum]|uniref:HTH CENPB-type domain-containing protein n=1 Tax=Acyrthosiphon pisum TaxID=7029 RepID=A0A8R1X3W9_ACYPI|nr:tigger transposable element-derived protein 4-like [Acyrthosiphon pisum]|eukprot:XP_008180353.1 PREDICTED: tigger transposable element-derived protein 4-like [Acyrthosiphon pisum]
MIGNRAFPRDSRIGFFESGLECRAALVIGGVVLGAQGAFGRTAAVFGAVLRQNVPVSGRLLKETAKSFTKDLGIPFFSASDGRLMNFMKRNGIVFKNICGESSSVDDNVCSDWHRKLSTLLKNYEPRNVSNTDETALFFKCLSDKTFTFKEEKCHGEKHSKDRLTILQAVNMDGSEKLTSLIGKAAKPRCFKGIC